MNRRSFIRMGAGVAASALLLRNPLNLLAASREDTWEAPREGRISYVSGTVTVNGREAAPGTLVASGDLISTGPDSEADVEIRDVSIFHIKEDTQVKMENLTATPSLRVTRGWFLTIVKRKTPFNVETPTVLAGVRGTVFFFRIYDEERTYLCDCNGTIELYETGGGRELRRIRSVYHTAFMISRADGEVQIERSPLLFHEDQDILRMSDRFARETRIFRQKQEERDGGGGGGY
jgi:ferric-dicitrate binding protein FerR (iron transport regulator)